MLVYKSSISNLLITFISFYFLLSNFSRMFPFYGSIYKLLILIPFAIQFYISNKISGFMKALFLLMFVGIFQFFFILYGLAFNAGDAVVALTNSAYLIIFLLLPAFIYIISKHNLSKLLEYLSSIMLFKVSILALFALDLNFGSKVSEQFLINNTNYLLHPYLGFYRLFDSFIVFFPLVFYAVKDMRLQNKIFFNFLLFVYIIFSFSVGMYLVYFVIISFLVQKKYFIYFACFFIICFQLYDYEFIQFVDRLYYNKSIDSVSVKHAQISWINDNLSILGAGIGYTFNIEGRIDTVLENIYIYWIASYGIVGVLPFYFIILILPLFVFYKYHKVRDIKHVFLLYLSIMLSSLVNPYALSGVALIPLLILIAYGIYKFSANKVSGRLAVS